MWCGGYISELNRYDLAVSFRILCIFNANHYRRIVRRYNQKSQAQNQFRAGYSEYKLQLWVFAMIWILFGSFWSTYFVYELNLSDLSLDAMDSAGDQHLHIDHNIYKRRVDLDGNPIDEAKKEDIATSTKKLENVRTFANFIESKNRLRGTI